MPTSSRSPGGTRRVTASASSRKREAQRARAAQQRAGEGSEHAEDREALAIDRSDLYVGGAVAVAALAMFWATFSSSVALGDAPEAVAGVRTSGILHAPGYVTYTLAARAFGEVFRFGSWELRVNLFSVVCATATILLTYLLARAFSADRVGAAVGSLALAATASFWFNAGFAKHYAFSALLVVGSAFLVVRWQQRDRPALLIAAGAVLGASLGAGWQLALIMAVGLAVLLWFGPRRPSTGTVLRAAGAALIALIAVCVYILVRAGQDPALNFGHASNLSRLFELLATSDFGSSRQAAGAGQVSTASSGVFVYMLVVARDLGLGAILLAAVGVFDVSQRRRWDHLAFFGLVGLVNVAAVGLVSGLNQALGFYTGLVSGGLLIDVLVVLAVLAALGTTRVMHALSNSGLKIAAAVVVAAVVIGPSLLVHYRYANHRMPPLADRYAARVLAGLPRDSVLVSGGFEFDQPITLRQLVHGDRPDVHVVSADQISLDWYREQLVREFALDPALLKPTTDNWVARFVTALRQKFPTYLDTYGMYNGRQLLPFRADGFVGKVVEGAPGPQPATGSDVKGALQRRADELQQADVADGLAGKKYLRFPNLALYYFHERAHVELAKQFAMINDLDAAANEIDRARSALPADISANLAPALRQKDPDAKTFLLQL